MYHIVTALLFKTGIKCENHSASIILLKAIFDINNSDIRFAKKERVDKQYYTDFHIAKKEVDQMMYIADVFTREMFDFISRLSYTDIKNYREKFSDMF